MAIDWVHELLVSIRLIVAFLLGAIIGWEREHHGQEAGIRTFGLISLGACSFGLISIFVTSGDQGRIAAQIVSGIGFLGAGVIMRHSGHIKGITTAATIWCSASVGTAIAFDMYVIGILTAAIILLFHALRNTKYWSLVSNKKIPPYNTNKDA
ncbi:MgtC/SapB family protein [Candidatus Odyssella thessalonicensis]|uniref:MgtC/SapB family protein n=1 Tax=Candidatus Odyssella thessalonicensis TaxID=84647 RepID=UPI000225AEA2|nr:MgtC/SapB family protein [Candidatus Odyssella thessalonicensis]